jgi:succinate-acetate transporter protein
MAEIAEIRDYPAMAKHESWTKAGPVVSHMPDSTLETLEERAVATIGDSSPLGLWGFATGTWISAVVVGGLLPFGDMGAVAPIVLLFAGIAQFIAGLYAYRRVNALLANAFCCFGSFNTVLGVVVLLEAAQMVPAAQGTNLVLGFFFESFGFIAFALGLGALRTNVATVGMLTALAIGYILAGIPFLDGTFTAAASGSAVGIVGLIGACFLFVSSLLAYYTGAAMLVNSTWKRNVLPILGEP